MPEYVYRCGTCGIEQSLVRRMSEEHPESLPCPCGVDAVRFITPPNLIANASRFSLRRSPENKDVYENEKAVMHLRVPDLDKYGRRRAFIPKIPCDPSLPREERMKHVINAENWTPPNGTVNPLEFKADPDVMEQTRRSYLKGAAKL